MSTPVSGAIDLSGRKALVSGAARGIGRAAALAMAREGADVACLDILDCAETARLIQKMGRQALAIKTDVRSPEEVEAGVGQVLSVWRRVDILVSSHGILGRSGTPLPALDLGEWDRLQEVNLRGAFLLLRAVWPVMQTQGGGKVVFLGSIAGRVGGVLAGPHYCSSKGGVHALAKWAAKNGAAHGILVNVIAPGPIATPMIADEPYQPDMSPLGRLGEPEDIAEAVVFLASQASNYITGIVLDVNGGILMA
ncbi:MAG: SDR family oxidoreductase [Desulfarculaceae bacterium]|nr:SDR family oxidoreductase [Desulfarculaceae bacterium]MCF8049520.1 SDR family oxidoreductase [Desulfarculaceae bacterium]